MLLNNIFKRISKYQFYQFKRGFIYKYQEPESKRVLNEITMLLVNSNKDCKNEFNRYVDTCVKIDKILQKVDTYRDYEKVKNSAKSEILKCMSFLEILV